MFNIGYHQHKNEDAVFDSLACFMKLWGIGKEAFFNVRCIDGRAWMSLNTFVGLQESVADEILVAKNNPTTKEDKPKGSPSERRRN